MKVTIRMVQQRLQELNALIGETIYFSQGYFYTFRDNCKMNAPLLPVNTEHCSKQRAWDLINQTYFILWNVKENKITISQENRITIK